MAADLDMYPASTVSGYQRPASDMPFHHQRPASDTPLKWRIAGGPLVARGCLAALEDTVCFLHSPVLKIRELYSRVLVSELCSLRERWQSSKEIWNRGTKMAYVATHKPRAQVRSHFAQMQFVFKVIRHYQLSTVWQIYLRKEHSV